MSKVPVAIIGSGNIGTDLLIKALRSDLVRPAWMVGIDRDSDGLSHAADLGLKTTSDGVDGLLPHMREDGVRIAFDATSASVHAENDRKLQQHGVTVVDMTPAAIGPYCVPSVNLREYLGTGITNLNMVSCGGQATIPIVAAVTGVQPVAYGEIVATIASKSAGPGTRKNIDEFTRTTARGIETVGGARKGKAIIILNPAEPPLIMRNTVHVLTESTPQKKTIEDSVHKMIETVRTYVPGYNLINGPVFDGDRISVYLEIEGLGDYLPSYAGNLDIMTSAALRVGEVIAEDLVKGEAA